MRQASHQLSRRTHGRGLVDITPEVADWVGDQHLQAGLLTVFCRHTSASLLIQENADPDVQTDVEAFFETIAPESSGRYVHEDEGPEDMPAHLRTALTQVQLSIPILGARMTLGVWQAIYLFEHRAQSHQREIALHLIGE